MIPRNGAVAGTLLGVFCCLGHAGQPWILVPIDPTLAPTPRGSAGLAYGSNGVTLFGGTGDNAFGDTWKWNGWNRMWTRLFPQSSPSPRYLHGMVGLNDGSILAFGGWNDELLADSWLFQNGNWQQDQNGANGAPPGGYAAAMAYDALRNVVVLFGGSDGAGQAFGDTWEWDAVHHWMPRNPLHKPSARFHSAMAFDTSCGRCVLFGGSTGGDLGLADTWEWDGNDWSTGPTGPPGRYLHAMAFDPVRGLTVVFGGNAGPSNCDDKLRDTWFLDCSHSTWTQGPDGPPADPNYLGITGVGLAYDPTVGAVVLFGGGLCAGYSGETWELPSCDSAPTIWMNPASQVVDCGSTVTLSVAAGSPTPVGCQWQFNGVDLSDGKNDHGSEIAGSKTNALTITRIQSLDQGTYTCIVTNACGNTPSANAVITVLPTHIAGDLNDDGEVDLADLAILLSNYGRACH